MSSFRSRTGAIGAALAMMIAMLGFAALPPAHADVTVGVRVDAHVNQAFPTTNYETSTVMPINDATNDRYVFLKVDVPPAPAGEVHEGGVLRFFVASNGADANPHMITVDKVSNNWTETGVTWDVQPAVEVANLATVPFSGNGWYEVPVANITPGSTASFRLTTTSGGFLNIDSQENASGNGPQFRLVTALPTPKVIIGMSARAGDWSERLADVGRCGIEARRIFADLVSSGSTQTDLIEQAISAGMTPVISYKVPSVATLNNNGYDAWLNNLNTYLAGLNTVVSVTFWHEPRGDVEPAAFRAGSQQFLDHLNDPDIKVGPILNGWLLDNRVSEWASYTSPALISQWDFMGLDTYQPSSQDDSMYGGRAVPLARDWLDGQGFVNEQILVGEYNGWTATSLQLGGEQMLKAENKVWIAALWNSHVDGGLGSPLEPGTARMAAFKATKADSRALHEEGC